MREGVPYADSARLADIDIRAMRDEAAAGAGDYWDKATAAAAGQPALLPWDELRKTHTDIDEARKAYWAQPMVKALTTALPGLFDMEGALETIGQARDAFCDKARTAALATRAYVKDGQWHEPGKMGWFGVSHDDRSADAWHSEMAAMIDGLPPSTWLTIVDCHI